MSDDLRIVYVAPDCPAKAAELASVIRYSNPVLAGEILGGLLPIRVSTLIPRGHVYIVDPTKVFPVADPDDKAGR